MLQTQLLAFSDHFSLLDLSSYEELSLMDHIRACDKIYELLSVVAFDLNKRILLKDSTGIVDDLQYLRISPSVLDSIKSTCDDSARQAFLRSVYILQDAKRYLLENMFHELAEGWIGGILCKALVNTLSQWVDMVREIMPKKFVRVTFVETSRLMIIMYINRMVTMHQMKKSTTLSPRGIQQLKSDLKTIHSWIVDNTSFEECQAEKKILQILFQDGFVTCSDSDALPVFAQAVRSFGIKHEYAMYDLFRLILKFRSDITTKVRKSILALCNEYLHQLHNAIQTDPQLLQGEIANTHMIDVLFPQAGVEHCTGTKWKIEKLLDPTASRLTVTLLVTDTINEGMEFRRRTQMLCTVHKIAESEADNAISTVEKEPVASSSTQSDSASSISLLPDSNRTPPPRPPPPPPRRATIVESSGQDISKNGVNPTTPSLVTMGLFAEVSSESDDICQQVASSHQDNVSSQPDQKITDTYQHNQDPPLTATSSKAPPPKPQRRATAPVIASALLPKVTESSKEVTEQDAIAMLLDSAKKKLEGNN